MCTSLTSNKYANVLSNVGTLGLGSLIPGLLDKGRQTTPGTRLTIADQQGQVTIPGYTGGLKKLRADPAAVEGLLSTTRERQAEKAAKKGMLGA